MIKLAEELEKNNVGDTTGIDPRGAGVEATWVEKPPNSSQPSQVPINLDAETNIADDEPPNLIENKKVDPREFGAYRVPVRLSKQALLDVLCNKSVPQQPYYRCVNLCISCCCPCVILGNIQTAISREQSYRFTTSIVKSKYLQTNGADDDISGSFGPKGFNKCALTCCLASLCWPFSPLLGTYLIQQRAYYRKIYREPESRLSFCESFSDSFFSCLFWPVVILQHAAYIRQKNEEGLLIFDWEHEVLRDMKIKKPPIENKIVLIVGPRGTGKTALFIKLVGAVEKTVVEDARDGSKIHIGIRGVSVTDEKVSFLEFWDVPFNQLESLSFQAGLAKAHAIVFVFDGSEPVDQLHSFVDMQKIFDAICIGTRPRSRETGQQEEATLLEQSGPRFFGRKLCAATKIDLAKPDINNGNGSRPTSAAMERAESRSQMKSSRPFREALQANLSHSRMFEAGVRQPSVLSSVVAPIASKHTRIQLWSRRNATPIVETSVIDNTGITRLLRLLRVEDDEFERLA